MKLAPKLLTLSLSLMWMPTMVGCTASEGISGGGDLDTIISNQSIVIGTNAEYAPFEFVGCGMELFGMCFSSEIMGFDIEVAKLIGKAISEEAGVDIQVTFKNMAFDGLLGSLQAGEIDLIAAAFSVNEERDEVADFSDVYYQAQTVLVTLTSNDSISTNEDLLEITLGAQTGTLQHDFAIEATGDESKVKALDSLTTLTLDLKVGNIDGLLVELPVAENIVATNPDLKVVSTLEFADDDGYAFATLNGKSDLITLINSVIADLKADGTLDALYVQAVLEAAKAVA